MRNGFSRQCITNTHASRRVWITQKLGHIGDRPQLALLAALLTLIPSECLSVLPSFPTPKNLYLKGPSPAHNKMTARGFRAMGEISSSQILTAIEAFFQVLLDTHQGHLIYLLREMNNWLPLKNEEIEKIMHHTTRKPFVSALAEISSYSLPQVTAIHKSSILLWLRKSWNSSVGLVSKVVGGSFPINRLPMLGSLVNVFIGSV